MHLLDWHYERIAKKVRVDNASVNANYNIKLEKWGKFFSCQSDGYSIETILRLMYLNLQISSKKSSALLWLLFIWRIFMVIFLKFLAYRNKDSRVLIFCSAFKGDLIVITSFSRQGITNLESTCQEKEKQHDPRTVTMCLIKHQSPTKREFLVHAHIF